MFTYFNELNKKLNTSEIIIYGLIHAIYFHNNDEKRIFYASNSYIEKELGLSRNTIIHGIKSLKEKGFIDVQYYQENNISRRLIVPKSYDEAIKLIAAEEEKVVKNMHGGSAKIELEVVKNMHGGSAKTRHNINNRYKDIDISTRYNINSNFTPDGVIGASSDPSVPVPNEFKFNPLEKWNEIAERYNLPTVNVISKQRLSKLKQRFKNIGGEDDFWVVVEKAIEASPFLRGQNDRKWRANLDFFLRESSFIKAAEGVYSHGNLLEEQDKPLEDKKKDDVLSFFFD